MAEQEVPSAVAQRIINKFLTNKGVKPSEIRTQLTAQFGEITLSRAQVFHWAKKFKEGWEAVQNESHQKRPRTKTFVLFGSGPMFLTNIVPKKR